MTDSLSDSCREIVLALIEEISENKSDRDPSMVLMHEILNSLKIEVQEAIHKLIAEKRLTWRRTVNGEPMFSIIKPKQ